MKIKIDGAIVHFIPETQEEIKDLDQKTPPILSVVENPCIEWIKMNFPSQLLA